MTTAPAAAVPDVPAGAALPLAQLVGTLDPDHLPGRVLDRGELLGLAAAIAARGVAGHPVPGTDDAGRRHYVSVHRDEHVDVWLLFWAPDNDTGWHDHGVSSGAVAVVRGDLVEHNLVVGGQHARTRVRAGHAFAFGPEHIHRLTGAPECASGAVSVHVYSPPLQQLGRYTVDTAGVLRRETVPYTEELRA